MRKDERNGAEIRQQSRKLKEMIERDTRDVKEGVQLLRHIDLIHKQMSFYTQKLVKSQMNRKQLEMQIHKTRSELERNRIQRPQCAYSRTLLLENRLEVALVKRNETDAVNAHLCVQLDRFQRERSISDAEYSKMEREATECFHKLSSWKRELAIHFQAKECVEHQMEALQVRVENEEIQFADEMTQWNEMKAYPIVPAISSVRKSKASVHNRDVQKHQMATALEVWVESIRSVRLEKMEKLIQTLLEKEDANFKRFQRIEDLQHEQIRVHRQCEEIERAIDMSKAESNARCDPKHSRAQMDERIREEDIKQRAIDAEQCQWNGQLTRVKASIHSIYTLLLHAGSMSSEENIAKSEDARLYLKFGQEITNHNVFEYLQAIEVFISALVQAQRSNSKEKTHYVPVGKRLAHLSSDPSTVIQLEIPTFTDDRDGVVVKPSSKAKACRLPPVSTNDDSERVWTHKELCRFAEKSLQREK